MNDYALIHRHPAQSTDLGSKVESSSGRTTTSSFNTRMLPDYYEVLDIPETASRREIEAAYWRRARQRRDLVPLLNEAIDLLSDKQRRATYDAERKAKREQLVREARKSADGPSIEERVRERWGY